MVNVRVRLGLSNVSECGSAPGPIWQVAGLDNNKGQTGNSLQWNGVVWHTIYGKYTDIATVGDCP